MFDQSTNPTFTSAKEFFFIRRFFFERQRTIGLKSHLLKVETERKLMPLASLVFPRQRLHWTSSISHPHHTLFWFSHFSTRNPIFWGRKPNFLAKLWEGQNLIYNRFGWEMSLLDVRSYIACKQLQSLTKAQTQVEHCLKCCLQWFWKGSWKAYCLSWGEGTKMQTLKTWQEFGRKCKVFSPKIWNIVAYFKCTCVGLRQHCLDFRARNRRWFMIIERKCIDSDVRDISWETAQKLLKRINVADLWEMIICSVY